MADMAFADSRVELLARTSVPATDYARHKGAPVQNPRLETARVGRVGLSKGNPERLEKPESAIFAYATGFHGKFADITENHSIAVDVRIIPKKAKVEIDGVGLRIADDTGGGIKLYHIDNFLGSGKAVVKAWLKGGVNGTNRRIKYLGVDE